MEKKPRGDRNDRTIMKHPLDNLSDREWQLYNDTIFLKGTIENLTQQLSENGTFDKYRLIHQEYLELFNTTADDKTKSEALKRLTFLNWYSILEPSCFTGVDNLDKNTIFNSFSFLNDYIKNNKLDTEFIWMLSYYSCWDWIILTFSENRLGELTKFVKSVDTSILHVPKHQLPKGSMDNRGQMGIYWTRCSVEKEEIK
ncbi:MAG: hypothetical protein V4615_13760 [Bacteroidota bacterium]